MDNHFNSFYTWPAVSTADRVKVNDSFVCSKINVSLSKDFPGQCRQMATFVDVYTNQIKCQMLVLTSMTT